AIPAAGRNPPGGGLLGRGQGEGGFLVDDIDPALAVIRQFFLLWYFIAKSHTIVKHTHAQNKMMGGFFFAPEGDCQFVMLVAHQATLTPGLLPGGILLRIVMIDNLQITHKTFHTAKLQSERRRGDDFLTLELNAITGHAILIVDIKNNLAIG